MSIKRSLFRVRYWKRKQEVNLFFKLLKLVQGDKVYQNELSLAGPIILIATMKTATKIRFGLRIDLDSHLYTAIRDRYDQSFDWLSSDSSGWHLSNVGGRLNAICVHVIEPFLTLQHKGIILVHCRIMLPLYFTWKWAQIVRNVFHRDNLLGIYSNRSHILSWPILGSFLRVKVLNELGNLSKASLCLTYLIYTFIRVLQILDKKTSKQYSEYFKSKLPLIHNKNEKQIFVDYLMIERLQCMVLALWPLYHSAPK